MTMSVTFCLSYDPLKWDFIAFKMGNISRRKRIVDMDVVSDVTSTYIRVLLQVWSYDCYDTTLSTEYKQRHMIKKKYI